MKLHCRLTPDSEKTRDSITARLEALGCKYVIDIYGAIVVNYEGACDGKPLAIITVFESFGCDRVYVLQDWRSVGKGQEA